MKLTNDSLAEILTRIVRFSMDNYGGEGDEYPEDVMYDCAYICACFVAQHTRYGLNGVESEEAIRYLKIGTFLMDDERLKLAEEFIKAYS